MLSFSSVTPGTKLSCSVHCYYLTETTSQRDHTRAVFSYDLDTVKAIIVYFLCVSVFSLAVVLVVAVVPEAGLVATKWRAVEPPVHAPEDVQPALVVFTFLVGRARSPESGGLPSPDTRPKRNTTPLPWSTVDPALHLLRQQRWHRRSRSQPRW